MSAQKILIIVLVVLVVIFVITVGVGGCHGGGKSDDAGAVKALKGLQGNRFLRIGDKATTTCAVLDPDGRILRVAGECAVTLAKRAFFRTSTRIAFRRCIDPPGCQAPSAFPIFQVLVNPKDGPQQDEQLLGERCFGSAINRSGGTMTLRSANTTIVLQQQGCPE
jgi:hypothetical protein